MKIETAFSIGDKVQYIGSPLGKDYPPHTPMTIISVEASVFTDPNGTLYYNEYYGVGEYPGELRASEIAGVLE